MESRDFWDKLAQEFRDLLREHGHLDLSAILSEGGWSISSISEGDAARFRSVFESLSTEAATGGDLVASDEGPVDAWLNRLRQGPHFKEIPGRMGVVGGVTDRSPVLSSDRSVAVCKRARQGSIPNPAPRAARIASSRW